MTETSKWSNSCQGEEAVDWEPFPGKPTENHSRAWGGKLSAVSC